MQLRPFEAGRYDDELIVIRNPENGRQELFTEEEFEIVRFLKQNESETLLALILPNIGIAKKQHIVICLKVLGKLKNINIVDPYSIVGRKQETITETIDLELKKERIQFKGLHALAAVIFSIFDRSLSWLGRFGILLLLLGLMSVTLLRFPFESAEVVMQTEQIDYFRVLLMVYFTGCAAFALRVLFQSAFLRASRKSSRHHGFALYFPFISLHADKSDVNLIGFQSRVLISFIGFLVPLALSGCFTLLLLIGKISLVKAFFAVATCIGVTLILLSPILSFDLAQMLQMIVMRRELKLRISKELRSVFVTSGALSKSLLVGLMVMLVWVLVWLDGLRSFWDILAARLIADYFQTESIVSKAGAASMMTLLIGLACLPFVIFLLGSFDRSRRKKRRIELKSHEVKENLTFEERMQALEKIPLFSYLNDEDRLALINEMQPIYFKDGDFLMHQGEIGKEFFVLVKGSAAAIFTDNNGKQNILAALREGDAFGEIALIDDVPRTASIQSDGGCIVLVLKKDGFVRFANKIGSLDRVKVLIRLTSFFLRHPLFSRLKAKDQALLIDSFRYQMMMAGEEVPDAESDENFYVIYSGKIKVDPGDDAAEIELSADDCFGYANVLNAKYVAMEGTGLLSVKQHEFNALIWEKLVEHPHLFF